uniref:Uncharacterized protein n=1 Tax=Faecalibaculum rodentium TaxID=1702221 RepID=A0A140DRG4_9FIRM|nr:hypothetical protein AALO17_01070 [Faecalibaculum rodentium]
MLRGAGWCTAGRRGPADRKTAEKQMADAKKLLTLNRESVK